MSLVLNNKEKGMQSSSEQPLVREEHWVTTLITATKEITKGVTWEDLSWIFDAIIEALKPLW